MKKLCLILFSLTVFSNFANARARTQFVDSSSSNYILEPYVGFESGYLTQKGIQEMTILGVNFGARLGFYVWGIGMGVDFMSSSQTLTQAGQKSDYKPTDYGIFFKYGFLESYNIYGSYFFVSNSKVQPDENKSDFSGAGYKLGLGWKVYSFCEIGVELITRKYTKYDSQSMANTLLGSTAGLSIAIPPL